MRLILDPPAPGAQNMALDEALLEAVSEGLADPTLRFYTFAPAALTLGYSQQLPNAHRIACLAAGVDVVRRPTGGRAVLHDRDLTYSVVEPIPAGETVASSYCRLSKAIALAIGQLGLLAEIAPGNQLAGVRPMDCFAVATAADLIVAGRKMVGSAQVRRRGFLLQHGSIRLIPGRALLGTSQQAHSLAEALGVADPDAAWLAQVRDRLGREIAHQLQVPWQPAAWSAHELARAAAIAA